MPNLIEGVNYTIWITADYIIAESVHHEYVAGISPVTGNITKGVNVIRKEEGVVYLNV
jgi:hypothetical protein